MALDPSNSSNLEQLAFKGLMRLNMLYVNSVRCGLDAFVSDWQATERSLLGFMNFLFTFD